MPARGRRRSSGFGNSSPGCRNLRAVTFAISRPYLASDDQADALVRLALAASLSLPTARIQFEPFAEGRERPVVARPGVALAKARGAGIQPNERVGRAARLASGESRADCGPDRSCSLGETSRAMGERSARHSSRGQESRALDRQDLARPGRGTGRGGTENGALGCGGVARGMDRAHAGTRSLQSHGGTRATRSVSRAVRRRGHDGGKQDSAKTATCCRSMRCGPSLTERPGAARSVCKRASRSTITSARRRRSRSGASRVGLSRRAHGAIRAALPFRQRRTAGRHEHRSRDRLGCGLRKFSCLRVSPARPANSVVQSETTEKIS